MVFYGRTYMERISKIGINLVLLASATLLLATRFFTPAYACPNYTQVQCGSSYYHTGNSYTLNGFSAQGRVHLWTTIGGSMRVEIFKNGGLYTNIYPAGTGEAIAIDVVATDHLTFKYYDCYSGNCGYADVGWEVENVGGPYPGTCGSGCPCPTSGGRADGNYGFAGTSGFKSMIANSGTGSTVGQLQCWGDWAEWSGDLDFNDFMVSATFEPTCNCTPISCPAGDPASKFMTRTISQGTGVACNSCVPSNYNCDPLYRNTTPTCSISPGSTTMTREDAPKTVNLTINDADYGDNVKVTGVKIVDGAGKLKSCVKVKTTGGGSLEQAIVKVGSNNPSDTTQITPFILDASESHGIFDNSSGQSVCSGTIELTLADEDMDGGGNDVSSSVTCSMNITVTNQAPQLTDVTLYDKDPATTLRQSGDLIDGTTVNVGSPLVQKRATTCTAALPLTDPIACAGANLSPFATKRNPLQLEFTVNDPNGADDIMQAGIWIQRIAQSGAAPTLPVVDTTARNSFQALYSEKESSLFDDFENRYYFVSRACLAASCAPRNIFGSNKQIFSGLALITEQGARVANNGNVSDSPYRFSSYREWQKVGYPDCLDTPAGCTQTQVPANSQFGANSDKAQAYNYDWSIAADDTHLLCYPSNSTTPVVVMSTVPIVCPAGCAACIKKEGIAPVTGSTTALTFKFGVYFNDKEGTAGNQGMEAGNYAIFLSALDKVGVPLANVTGKGDEGWIRFDRFGTICTGATCPNGDFVLNYDPIAPVVSSVTWQPGAGNDVNATINVTENTGGSGVAGLTTGFMARQEVLDGEPLGERTWAKRSDGVTDFNGANYQITTTSTSIILNGKGIQPGEEVVTGACVYDKAGNMGCGKNLVDYTFLGPWLKTSLGDVYSNRTGEDTEAFQQTLPTADDHTAGDSALYLPFKDQLDTVATGLLISGVHNFGLSGGYLVGGVNKPLGFEDEYRTVDISAVNIADERPNMPGLEYDRLRASALKNCDISNTLAANTCVNNTDITSASVDVPYKVITISNANVNNIVCKQSNVIFVTGLLVINGNVTKADTSSACLFVIAGTGTLQVLDTPSDTRGPLGADGKGTPTVDIFEGAVVAGENATVIFSKGTRGATTKSTDRLKIHGWVYTASKLPQFLRVLAPVDNRRFPSEWVVYDATLLDSLRYLLGTEKTVDLTCGTSNHVLCASGE